MTSTLDILAEFDSVVGEHRLFAEKLRGLVMDILSLHNLPVHSVTSRTKARDSFAEKVARSEGRYRTVADVTDLCGVRIITYFGADVDRIADALAAEFEIDAENSVDKRAALDPDQFGYLSVHYVIELPARRVALAEYRRFKGMKAEVQVRSILQHAWAEIEHDLGYKTKLAVPRDIRRDFFRLAGLLELADKEFSTIRDSLKSYETEVSALIVRSANDVLLDKASLAAYLKTSETVAQLDGMIAGYLKSTSQFDPQDDYLERHLAALALFGISSVGMLDEALRGYASVISRFARSWITLEAPQAPRSISLFYLTLVLAGDHNNSKLATDLIALLGLEGDQLDQRISEGYALAAGPEDQ